MKNISILVLLSTIVFSTPSMAAHSMCGKTELADIMGTMKDQMKAVKKALKSGDMDKMKSITNKLLAAIDKSYHMVPLAISDNKSLSAAQKSDVKKYQQNMNNLKEAIIALTAAKDLAAVKMALSQIGKVSKKGHKAYKMDCDD